MFWVDVFLPRPHIDGIAGSGHWASAAERHGSAPARTEFGVRDVSHPTPQTLRYLRDRAEACERLAETTISPETRETMLYLASRWRALADEDEAKLRPFRRTGPQHPA